MRAHLSFQSLLWALGLAAMSAGCGNDVAARLGPGSQCTAEKPCVEGASCLEGVCRVALGKPCASATACRPGQLCEQGQCALPELRLGRLLPVSGPTTGGTAVVVIGAGFVEGMQVSFGSAAATEVRLVSPTSLAAKSPPGASELVDVSMMAPDGRHAEQRHAFSYFDASATAATPDFERVLPASGPVAGGTRGLLTGTHFAEGARLYFGGMLAVSTRVVDDKRIVFVAPAHPAGSVDLMVVNPDGRAARLGDGFAYFDGAGTSPTIVGVTPDHASENHETAVDISGAALADGALVFVGDIPAGNVKTREAGSQLDATLPELPPGTYDVTVTNPDGRSTTLADAFVVTADLGQPCGQPGIECSVEFTCGGGFCRAKVGGDCSKADDCSSSLVCENGKCRAALAGPCTVDEQCAVGLACDAGACRRSVGGACAAAGDCASALVCDGNKCLAPSHGVCASTDQCATGLACDRGHCVGPVGDACQQEADCVSGLACDAHVCRVPNGGACATVSECANGLVCDGALCLSPVDGGCAGPAKCAAGLVCENALCRRPLGGACASTAQCVSGLACEGDTCRSSLGGACASNGQCQSPLGCEGDICRSPRGGACVDNASCQIGLPCESTTCRSSSGGGCAASAECVSGTSCEASVCRVNVGGSCATADACVAGLVCDAGVCHVPFGGACSPTAGCASGLTCEGGSCRRVLGENCPSAADCAATLTCEAGKCRSLDGGKCSVAIDCSTPLVCVSGHCQRCDGANQCGTGFVCDVAGTSAVANARTCQAGSCEQSVGCSGWNKCLWSGTSGSFVCSLDPAPIQSQQIPAETKMIKVMPDGSVWVSVAGSVGGAEPSWTQIMPPVPGASTAGAQPVIMYVDPSAPEIAPPGWTAPGSGAVLATPPGQVPCAWWAFWNNSGSDVRMPGIVGATPMETTALGMQWSYLTYGDHHPFVSCAAEYPSFLPAALVLLMTQGYPDLGTIGCMTAIGFTGGRGNVMCSCPAGTSRSATFHQVGGAGIVTWTGPGTISAPDYCTVQPASFLKPSDGRCETRWNGFNWLNDVKDPDCASMPASGTGSMTIVRDGLTYTAGPSGADANTVLVQHNADGTTTVKRCVNGGCF